MKAARQSSLSTHTVTIEINGNEVDVLVHADWSDWYPATDLTPEELAGYTVESVILRGADITDLVDVNEIAADLNQGEWD